MNDLTKVDLQIILLDMNININKAPPLKPSPSYLALRDKVQAMINNYCDHESDEQWYQLADCSYRYKRCSKCRCEYGRQAFNNETRVFEDDNQ